MVTVTALYASVLALFFMMLSFRTVGARRQANVLLGDGGDDRLLRHIRVQGNFAEYVPLALLLLLLAELQGVPALLLHGLGGLLLAGRLLHAFGLSRGLHTIKYRVLGVFFTFSMIITAAVVNLLMLAPALPGLT